MQLLYVIVEGIFVCFFGCVCFVCYWLIKVLTRVVLSSQLFYFNVIFVNTQSQNINQKGTTRSSNPNFTINYCPGKQSE